MRLINSNSPNAVEHLPPSLSPKYVENKQPEPSDGSHDCLHKNKSKTQINGRRNSKSDGVCISLVKLELEKVFQTYRNTVKFFI